jgi:hypothetical protein
MPHYVRSHNAGYTETQLRVPGTFNHMSQFLAHIDDGKWGHIRNVAGRALRGEIDLDRKIKPSSLKKIRDNRAVHLVTPLLMEHISHHDRHSEVHKGGGIHDALESSLQIVGGLLGGEKVNNWFGPEVVHKKLSVRQRNMARLVDATYKPKRPDEMERYTRVKEYDTNYGALWKGPNDYVFAVRGTKFSKLKDIWKDLKIMGGSTSQGDEEFTKSFVRFTKEHPHAKLALAGHSLGTEIAYKAARDDPDQYSGLEEIYLFNPASSPAQDKTHIRKIIGDQRVQLFLNKGDVVSNYFSQNLKPDEQHRVHYGRFSRAPQNAHGLAQWTEVESY